MGNTSTTSICPTIIAGLLFVIMFSCLIYFIFIKDFIANKKVRIVKTEALKGNKYALQMIRYQTFFKHEETNLINEALNGNVNALIIMGYTIEEKK